MRFRKAEENDAAQVAMVLAKSYNMDSEAEAAMAFRRELRQEKNFVLAEDGCAVVGVASWQMHDLPKHMLAELHRIAVMPECRGNGVARGLFDFLLEDCNAFYKQNGLFLRKMFLLTHHSNARARRFYEKLGFSFEARLPSHYYESEDELVYSMFPAKNRGAPSAPREKMGRGADA